jgi:pimeloyl-ACP methyl ester carboxylesterase
MQALFSLARAAGERDPNRPAAARRTAERMGAEAYWARIQAKLLAMDPVAFATLGPMLSEHARVADRLAELACPTLVIVGEEDAPFRAPSELLAKLIRGARHVVVPGAAHSPQLENPDAWLEAILEHLSESRRPSELPLNRPRS